MKYSNDSAINQLVLEKLRGGWTYRKSRKHHVLISPQNRRIAIPSSPSDRRSFLNFARRVQKLEL